jgi:hypothetical protein
MGQFQGLASCRKKNVEGKEKFKPADDHKILRK